MSCFLPQFGTAYAASECVKVFDGRFFGGRKLSCHFWDGVTNYTVREEDDKDEVGKKKKLQRVACSGPNIVLEELLTKCLP